MPYYYIDLMALDDPAFCFVKDAPEGTDALSYRMSQGFPMGEDYPEGATVGISEKYSGFQAPSIVGNTRSFLIVSDEVKGIIQELASVQIEWLPLTILDHRGKPTSTTHFVANPIGGIHCLDLAASDIVFSGEKIARIKRPVIDEGKAAEGGHLFRLGEEPRRYVISGAMAQALQALPATNLKLIELATSGSEA